MSPADHKKPFDSTLLCNLARIDTSNDWSDMESLGSLHSGPHIHSTNARDIEVIPSTPNKEDMTDDAVASLREMDSLVVPSITESDAEEAAFSSFVISVTNLDLEGAPTEEWETTLQNNNSAAQVVSSRDDEMTNVAPEIPTRNHKNAQTIVPSVRNDKTSLKPIIRPRLPSVSAMDKENVRVGSSHDKPILLRRSSGHRRVSFNSLPSPKELEEHGVELSLPLASKGKHHFKSHSTKPRSKKTRSRRRPKVLNVTTSFR